jgi:tetratricopeptide (TPR) repeat protein
MSTCAIAKKPHRRERREVPAAETPPPSAILRRRSTNVGLCAVFLASLAFYTATCATTVTGEDSGELITAAYTLGVAHPPGYPLWCLLAKGATLVPIGEVAFRVAMVSAVFGALTIVALAAILLLITQSWLPALAASFAFGLLRDQWSQATIAEVYTLNTFFLALCTLLLLLWSEKRSWRLFYAFAFFYGLSLTNHLTMLGAAPAFLLFLLIKGIRLLRRWPRVLGGVACFAAGLLPYAYLPIAASRNPAMNWGAPTTLQGVIDHVTRRQYLDAEELPARSWDRFSDQLSVMGEAFVGQGLTPLLVLGLIALVWIARTRFTLFLVLFGVAAASSIGFILQTNVSTDFESAYASRLFHVPAWMMLTVAFGVGLGALLTRLPRVLPQVAVGSLAVLLCTAPPLLANLKACDYSDYRVLAAYGRRLLVSLPGNAIVFPSSDHNTFPLLYLRYVDGLREDVTIADKYGYVDPEIVSATPFGRGVHPKTLRTRPFREAVESWVIENSNRPVFFSNKGRAPEGFDLLSEGLWYRARRISTAAEQLRMADDAAWCAVEATEIDEEPSPYDYSARMVLSDVAFAKARRACSRGEVVEALAECRKAADHVPASKEIQNNLGSLLAEAGQFEAAKTYFARAVEIDPSYATAVRNLATSLRASGDLAAAKRTYLRLLELSPLDPSANKALADIAKAEGDFRIAALHLEEFGKVAGDPFALRDAGLICLFELRELKRAKELLRASLAINPNQPDVAEVEEQIKRAGDEKPKQGESARHDGRLDPDDHEHHDCTALGCDAKASAQKLAGFPGIAAPAAPDPLSQVMPKTGVPDQRPNVDPATPRPRVPSGRARQ